MSTHFIKELIDLPSFEVEHLYKQHHQWIAVLQPKTLDQQCPHCGGWSAIHAWPGRRRLDHRPIPHFGWIAIDIPKVRMRCQTCRKTWSVKWPGIPQKGRATDCCHRVLADLCQNRDLLSVARLYAVPYTTLERWYYQMIRIDAREVDGSILCLDEFALHKGQRYAHTLMDHQTGKVLEAGRGRSRRSIHSTLKKWADGPDAVVTDLAPGMADTIHDIWPDTDVVADLFHVVQLFTDAMDRKRKFLGMTGKHRQTRKLMGQLIKSPSNHESLKETLTVEEMLSANTRLDEIYQALQALRRMMSLQNVEIARKALKDWFERYLFSEDGVVQKNAKTLQKWKQPLINYVKYKASNGPMEGNNNKIKLIQRRGYGYRNFKHLMNRMKQEISQRLQPIV